MGTRSRVLRRRYVLRPSAQELSGARLSTSQRREVSQQADGGRVIVSTRMPISMTICNILGRLSGGGGLARRQAEEAISKLGGIAALGRSSHQLVRNPAVEDGQVDKERLHCDEQNRCDEQRPPWQSYA